MNGLLKFIAGAAVGAAAVALLTPVTGQELQRQIKEILRRKGLIADEQLDDVVEMIAAELNEK